MEGELKKIKKLYGEDFAKLCRILFPRLLEDEGKLLEILTSKFAPSRSLYDEIIAQDLTFSFKGLIYKAAGITRPERQNINQTPEELLASAGYKLYRCKNDREVKSFRKYYEKNEQLCTFRDPGRIKSYDIFFVVREDVENIHRDDFKHPHREDRYGTSVMSLQFDREDGELSIKNRYNHSVENPDATYSNDLDSIVPGLTDSFAKYYGIDSRVDYSRFPSFHIGHFAFDKDGKAYKFNYYFQGVYYCENNIVIQKDATAIQYEKGRYELIGPFLLDKSEKTMKDLSGNNDGFQELFVDVDKIETEKGENETRKIIVTKNDGTFFTIVVDKSNTMIHYENKFQTEVGNDFLKNDTTLKSFSLPNVRKVGNKFLAVNTKVNVVDMPELEEIGDDFLRQGTGLHVLSMPSLKKVGHYFLYNATSIPSVSLPNLEKAGDLFLCYGSKLEFINTPKLREIGENALRQCVNLKSIDLPSLEIAGDMFMREHRNLESIYFPVLKTIGKEFMFANREARVVNLPAAESIGHNFMPYNEKISKVNLPVVKHIGKKFLHQNKVLRDISLPEVENIEESFLYKNEKLKTFYAPKLMSIGGSSLYNNKKIVNMDLPRAEVLGAWILHKNKRLKSFSAPNLKHVGDCFLTEHGKVKKVRVSNKELLPKYLKVVDLEEVCQPGTES